MSRSSNRPPVEKFQFPNSSKLWHDCAGLTKAIGCQGCAYRSECGGLHIGPVAFDCLTFCRCEDPSICDNVCPRNIEHFVARWQEVSGFGLENVAPTPPLALPELPAVVPMIYHSSARGRSPRVPVVALSLYELLNKANGTLRFQSREALLEHFTLGPDTRLILSGTETDPLLERWWQIADREGLVRGLAALGVTMITTPNYSLFDDVARTDNLFNMKRIAMIWSEIQREGMPCALHLNARTDRDWERWLDFLLARPEVAHVAFEFATGAGSKLRMPWHIDQLCNLARRVDRPLHLLVRGGLKELSRLRSAFAAVTLVDTSAFMKAQKRQRAIVDGAGLSWQRAPTPAGQTIDDLLDTNIEAVVRLGTAPPLLPSLCRPEPARHAGDEPLQVNLLTHAR
jgi:hypothetical protein